MSSRAARDARTGRSPPYVIRAVTGCVLHATNQVSGLLSGRQRFLSPRFCSFRRLSLWSRHRNHGGVVCFCGVRRTLLNARGCTTLREPGDAFGLHFIFQRHDVHIYCDDCRRTAVLNLVCEQSRLRSNLLFSERCLPVLFNNYMPLERAGFFLALKYPIVLFHSNRF